MRRALLCLAALTLLALSVPAAASEPSRYVEFLDEDVPVSELRTPVWAVDSTFRDYGAKAVRSELGLTGAGVGVCVLDTGADPTHEQLDSKGLVTGWELWRRECDGKGCYGDPTGATFWDFFTGYQYPEGPSYQPHAPYDDHGHGTHVASIAVGDGTGSPKARRLAGVAPEAALYVGKVLNADGSGSFEHVIAGIAWCADKPDVDIISMSIGSGQTNPDNILSDAIREATARGKTVVVAAGNSGPRLGTIGAPGNAPDAITVGAATAWSGKWQSGPALAGFSSRGAPGSDKPDVVAPGVNVLAANACCGKWASGGGYARHSGTSMATPFVAGLVALLEQQRDLSPGEAKVLLRSSALDAGLPGCDNDWGCGLVDLYGIFSLPSGFPAHETYQGEVGIGERWSVPIRAEGEIAVTVTMTGGDLGDYLAAVLTDDSPSTVPVAFGWCPNGSRLVCGGPSLTPPMAWRHQSFGIPRTDGPEHSVWVFLHPFNTPTGRRVSFVVDVFHR